jgi:hypothetical protein
MVRSLFVRLYEAEIARDAPKSLAKSIARLPKKTKPGAVGQGTSLSGYQLRIARRPSRRDRRSAILQNQDQARRTRRMPSISLAGKVDSLG